MNNTEYMREYRKTHSQIEYRHRKGINKAYRGEYRIGVVQISHEESTKHWRIKSRQWRIKNPDYDKEWLRTHYQNRDNGNSVRTPEQWRAQNIAEKIPLSEFCELCPEDDVRKATQRHHPDYTFPTIFASCCASCHGYVERGID